MTGDILGLIDGALEDWELCGDAMRWTPEGPSKADVATGQWIHQWRRQYGGRVTARQDETARFRMPPWWVATWQGVTYPLRPVTESRLLSPEPERPIAAYVDSFEWHFVGEPGDPAHGTWQGIQRDE